MEKHQNSSWSVKLLEKKRHLRYDKHLFPAHTEQHWSEFQAVDNLVYDLSNALNQSLSTAQEKEQEVNNVLAVGYYQYLKCFI